MKKFYAITLLFVAAIGFSQNTTTSTQVIPTGYYNAATGTGYTLKTQLYNIIQSHTTISYSPGLWNLYVTSDKRADGKVWDIYSSCNFNFGTGTSGNQDQGSGGTSECQFFNKEHTFPKSWFNNTSSPMYSDAFHVMPTDKKVNSERGNFAYGIVGSTSYTSSNGTKKGTNIAPNAPSGMTVFEPIDEYKGDIARNYFYMATCYQNLVAEWKNNNPNGALFLDGTSTKAYAQWALDMLYSWHVADPVSAKEIERNDAIYAVQRNRNPFIDHPEYVFQIWGTDLTLSRNNYDFATVAVYPNPSNNHRINIETEQVLDEIQLINVNGQLMQEIKNPNVQNNIYTLENLPSGFYFLKLTSDNQSTTKKVIVN